MKIKTGSRTKTFLIVIFLIMLDLFIVMGSSLNPFSKVVPSIDSSVFIYMGQRLRDGAVPYRDAFDHKGPLLYAIEWLGLTIGNGSTVGIWVIEFISMLFFLYFMYKIAKLFTESDIIAVSSIAFGTELLMNSFENGNFSEEYALPFIAFSLYVFLKYIYKDEVKYRYVAAAGACCGCVLLLRANMVSAWAAWAVVVIVMIIINSNKTTKEKLLQIIKLILFFTAGMIVAIAPFVIWYACKGALKIMYDTYIGSNMLYVGGNPHSISSVANVIKTYSHMMVQTTYIILLYIIAVICWSYHCKNSKKMLVIWGNVFYIIVTMYLVSVSGRNYSHYLMVFTPCLMLSLVLMLDSFRNDCVTKMSARYWSFILIVASVLFYAGPFRSQISTIRATMTGNEENDKLIAEIKGITSKEDEVFVLNNRVCFLVKTDRHTNFRYEFAPDFIDVQDDTIKYLTDDKPKVIVKLIKYEDGTNAKISSIDECAEKMCSDGIYTAEKSDYAILYIRN